MENININFDMDGTLADFYNVPNWLEYLINSDSTPYEKATPLLRFASLAKRLNNLQKKGYKINIVSWLAKNSTPEFDQQVISAKRKWLEIHLKSVIWDNIWIIPYGVPKSNYCQTENDILFDDEIGNRNNWTGQAYAETEIMEVLSKLN